MSIEKKYSFVQLSILFLMAVSAISGCSKFIEVKTPDSSLSANNIFSTDETAAAALTGIYAGISGSNINYVAGGLTTVSLYCGLSADELELYDVNNVVLYPYYVNSYTAINEPGNFWDAIYSIVYSANAAIAGLSNSSTLTSSVKQQLLGEAYFVRAFCYFQLINIYGDVPLVTSTDYTVNQVIGKSDKSVIWQQIIDDLHIAETSLSADFLDALVSGKSDNRVRPTKWAASALLAKTYLYTGNYSGADSAASAVIANPAFTLADLNSVFLMNSPEAIWQLQPTGTGNQSNTGEGAIFVLPPAGPTVGNYPVYLSNRVVNSFELNDLRLVKWTGQASDGTTTYFYPYKYKIGLVDVPTQEYIMVLRLGEQYLIRSEARIYMNNISGAKNDLNAIRERAGLDSVNKNDQTSLLSDIMHERQVELFTEWGNRWFDLKRTNAIDSVMGVVTPAKDGSWASYKALFPIPQVDILTDPKLSQNTGY